MYYLVQVGVLGVYCFLLELPKRIHLVVGLAGWVLVATLGYCLLWQNQVRFASYLFVRKPLLLIEINLELVNRLIIGSIVLLKGFFG